MELYLEEFRLNSFDDFYQLRCEKENIYWTGYLEAPKKEMLKKWCMDQIRRNDRFFYLVKSNKYEDKLIGYLYIDIISIDKGIMNISYGVSNKHTGNGIGTKLISLVKKHCEDTFKNVNKLEAWVVDNNIGSIKCFTNNKWVESNDYKFLFFLPLNNTIIIRKYILYLKKIVKINFKLNNKPIILSRSFQRGESIGVLLPYDNKPQKHYQLEWNYVSHGCSLPR